MVSRYAVATWVVARYDVATWVVARYTVATCVGSVQHVPPCNGCHHIVRRPSAGYSHGLNTYNSTTTVTYLTTTATFLLFIASSCLIFLSSKLFPVRYPPTPTPATVYNSSTHYVYVQCSSSIISSFRRNIIIFVLYSKLYFS